LSPDNPARPRAPRRPVSDIAFTPAVKVAQTRNGSRAGYARMEDKRGWADSITADLAGFIETRDSFYLGTASADGQPYIQHRGGPPGFLKVIDEHTLAFADFGGNRQFISAGNLSENDKAYIFLMDYPNRRRIKIWGRARVVEDDPALTERLAERAYNGRPERAIVFDIAAWDVNCPQHITRRFDEDEVAALLAPLQDRIAELETELASLRADGD
jgi:predicted pyridoxine 5'-phosphate oxidase superfamily flavin-nucleotide-binding protein